MCSDIIELLPTSNVSPSNQLASSDLSQNTIALEQSIADSTHVATTEAPEMTSDDSNTRNILFYL